MALDKSPVFYPTSLNKMTFLFFFIKNCNNSLSFRPTPEKVTAPEDNTLVGDIEAIPQFPGGQAKLMDFLAANVKYPEAVEGAVQGRVVVLFTVKKDGSIDNIEVIRSVCHELDEEAVRVVKLFPDFIPGTINGKPVDCK